MQNLVNLLKVKSLLSLGCLAVFVYLAITGAISGDTAITIISIVFTFYFSKKDKEESE